ncbi:metal ABC transporter substrate-binding protein [Allokutzneria sp. A3M-2-11 16]|uniref:metal ABC transporter substrate-binding protein n=1 Tax=Allokutzneria sp. A3M-2-11 16 TaxID=2962043 RepID=UPI0020B71C47|nr:metal ABC transporter substrate-binding protein [Allokutzneria sp. A3M-2-11 16]MCP3802115.1 metal ABC transporter substrate-binding protein [Allokutzneria sp. A3M-2-11 16]
MSRLKGIAGLVVAALLVAGCSDARGAGERKRVLTTFTVLADMTRAVAGNAVEVESITKPGAEIHEYEPTPSDLKKGAGVDLVLENGLGLERWFDRFMRGGNAKRATLSTGVEPIPIRSGQYEGKANPHAWMSPANARIYVRNIVTALSELDPANAGVFKTNAERYDAQLAEIDTFLRSELGKLPPNHRALVTCEGAFSYLARDAGLREAYLWPVNSDEEGTPQQIAATVTFVRENSVPAVFCESTVNDKAQQQVARETGAKMGGTLYVDSLSEEGGPVPTYLKLLRYDAETVVAGLTGGAR